MQEQKFEHNASLVSSFKQKTNATMKDSSHSIICIYITVQIKAWMDQWWASVVGGLKYCLLFKDLVNFYHYYSLNLCVLTITIHFPSSKLNNVCDWLSSQQRVNIDHMVLKESTPAQYVKFVCLIFNMHTVPLSPSFCCFLNTVYCNHFCPLYNNHYLEVFFSVGGKQIVPINFTQLTLSCNHCKEPSQ